jgi:uncharacterized membrane protein YdbT with pleckstrin-like domain
MLWPCADDKREAVAKISIANAARIVTALLMAMIACPECGREVSTAAKACPACGFPVAEKLPVSTAATSTVSDELLAEVRPSWWRYFWWLCFAWLIIPFIVAWIKRSAVVMRVYRGRVTLKRGILNKCERELFMRDVRSIDIDQSLLGRMVGIGDLSISTAASADAVESIEGVPNPQRIRDLIIAQRQAQ